MLHLGKTAKYVREHKGLTVRAAAVKLGISHAHLSNIENNLAAPSLQLLEQFRITYGIDLVILAWCLYGDLDRLPASVQGPMKALAEAWKRELGYIADNPRTGKDG